MLKIHVNLTSPHYRRVAEFTDVFAIEQHLADGWELSSAHANCSNVQAVLDRCLSTSSPVSLMLHDIAHQDVAQLLDALHRSPTQDYWQLVSLTTADARA